MVEEELRNGGVSEESKKNMLDILSRAEEGNFEEAEDEQLDSDDDEDPEDLSLRMADVNLDDCDAVWKNLTDNEKQEFRQLVNTGEFSHLLPPWVPWWRTEGNPRVQIVNPEEDSRDLSNTSPSTTTEPSHESQTCTQYSSEYIKRSYSLCLDCSFIQW